MDGSEWVGLIRIIPCGRAGGGGVNITISLPGTGASTRVEDTKVIARLVRRLRLRLRDLALKMA